MSLIEGLEYCWAVSKVKSKSDKSVTREISDSKQTVYRLYRLDMR
jgi:hypothetical protein